uniref:Uncharacterized protein n=1 Tax=Plectus sambesii TaxID=2011161 RepID=A0A914X695_9BILA
MQLRVVIAIMVFLGATLAAQKIGDFNENANAINNLHKQGLLNGGQNPKDVPNMEDFSKEVEKNRKINQNQHDSYAERATTWAVIWGIIIIILYIAVPLTYLIIWVVVALVGYHKWDWTVLATVLVLLLGPIGLIFALMMKTRTQEREMGGYYAGQARPT